MGVQIAQLENKIETLTSMLHSVVRTTGLPADPSSSMHDGYLGTINPHGGAIPGLTPMSNVSSLSFPSSQSSFQPDESSHSSSSPLYEPSDSEADHYFQVFENQMLPLFPFIHIPPTMTASQLRKTRPLLFRAIIAVATSSTEQKMSRIDGLRFIWAKSALTQDETNIDTLLSILTYITWSIDPFMKRTSNLSRMMMLAISLVYDLQKARPPPPEVHVVAKMAPGLGTSDGEALEPPSKSCYLEQQRAILACFVLSCYISSYFRRIDAMRWTSQMEEGLCAISENDERSSSDEAFVFHVRLQLLAQRVAEVRGHNNTNSMSPPNPPSIYVKYLQGQLDQLRASRSPNLPHMDMLSASSHHVELCINETVRQATSSEPLLPASMSANNVPGFEPVECLWRSLHAAKAWLDCFHSVSPSLYMGFPFFYWFQLVRCLVILKHLSVFEDPAWDRLAVYSTVDLLTVLEWMATKSDLASQAANEQSDNDMFRQVSKCLRLSQMWVTAKRDAAASSAQAPTALPCDNAPLADFDQAPWMSELAMGNESWIEEFFDWSPGTL
ncbi:unnamed protein product [Clonostachys rosea]|uniref:Transcription factor domain-containing protein n=1 Tax=Bionectria ochroleuca TaxID=29856 RepID=A0ABY6UJJ4_BIOOC|nr:unnamed protein product [Clonostachys rosea]